MDIRGLPDQFSGPTMCLNLQQVASILPAASATGTWSCELLFNPDGASFGYAHITDSTNSATGGVYAELLSNQLAPDGTYRTGVTTMVSNFERWRLVYAGATAYQDGPALANQGTVAACQQAFEPQEFAASPFFLNGVDTTSGTSGFSTARPLSQYQANDLPDYNKTQSMPNAYFSESKAGCYMPLRLGPNHQRWRTEKELTNFLSTSDVRSASANFPQLPWVASTGSVVDSVVIPAKDPSGASFWWPNMTAANASSVVYGGIATDTFTGHPPHPAIPSFTWRLNGNLTSSKISGPDLTCVMLPGLAENAGAMCFRNLAATTGIQVYFRVGIEAQVKIGSLYSPFLKIAPEYDPLAVEMYYKISRELKDAYPADFNDLGKLWEVIKGAARVVSGGLKAVPGPLGAIAGIVHQAIAPSGIEMKVGGNVAKRDSPPAAALERAEKAAAVETVLRDRGLSTRASRSRRKLVVVSAPKQHARKQMAKMRSRR